MALIDFYSDLKLIREIIQLDALGTHRETYRDVMEFKGAITTVNSTNVMRGGEETTESLFLLTTSKRVPLHFNDIIRDGDSYYQLTNDDMRTPKSAGLDIQQYKARKITLDMI